MRSTRRVALALPTHAHDCGEPSVRVVCSRAVLGEAEPRPNKVYSQPADFQCRARARRGTDAHAER